MNAGAQIPGRWFVLWLWSACIVFSRFAVSPIISFTVFFNFHHEPSYFLVTADLSVHTCCYRGRMNDSTQSSPKAVMMVRYHDRTISLWKFTMSSWSSLGAILTPSWDHGVLSVLNIHYRISDVVRSSAEVKGSRLSCLAPSGLTGRPPGVGFHSSTRHVEMRRMSGVMYIVTKPRQNWLWERVTAFISNGTAHTSTCLMYIDSRKKNFALFTHLQLRYSVIQLLIQKHASVVPLLISYTLVTNIVFNHSLFMPNV